MILLHANFGWTSWSWDPTVLLGVAALAGGYAWLFRGMDRRSEGRSPLRRVSFSCALLVLLLALESPIDVGGDNYLFSLHMLQHILLSMVVPPLLLLGLPEWWLAVDRVHIHPLAATLTFNGVLALWHLPLLYEATLRNELIHVAEHLSFLATGVRFWWPVVAPVRGRSALTGIGKIAYLAFAGVPPTILGLIFILSRSVLYPFYAAAPRVVSLSPLEDQLLGGLLMFGLGNLIYFAAIWILFFSLDEEDGASVREHATPSVTLPARGRDMRGEGAAPDGLPSKPMRQ